MGDKPESVTGGCLCGAVRYEASEPPHEVSYCHCRMCQKRTGSAFVVVATIPADSFRITSGELKFYKSSEILERGFCANCGSELMSRYSDPDSPFVWVKVGTLDHPEDAPPSGHVGIESQIPWLTIDDDLPRARTEDDPDFIAAEEAAERGEG